MDHPIKKQMDRSIRILAFPIGFRSLFRVIYIICQLNFERPTHFTANSQQPRPLQDAHLAGCDPPDASHLGSCGATNKNSGIHGKTTTIWSDQPAGLGLIQISQHHLSRTCFFCVSKMYTTWKGSMASHSH